MSEPKRVPIASSVTKDDVVRAAYFENMEMNNYIKGDDTRPTETIYNVPGEETFLHYIVDRFLGFPYIAFSGKNAEDLERRITAKVKTVTPDDLAHDFTSPPEDPQAMRRLIGTAYLLAPKRFDPKFEKYFRVGFEHEDPDVRRAAVAGVGYVGWPELAKPLRELAEKDPDADVRRDAKAMLGALEEGAK